MLRGKMHTVVEMTGSWGGEFRLCAVGNTGKRTKAVLGSMRPASHLAIYLLTPGHPGKWYVQLSFLPVPPTTR